MNLRYRDRYYADREGDELPVGVSLREHALGAASDLIRLTRTEIVRDWLDCTFEVTDEAGQIVLTMPFDDVVAEA